MAEKQILFVDDSTMRQPYLCELLQGAGVVTQFGQPNKALAAVKRGLGVDVAVLHYRLALTPLIQAIRSERPRARIIAFGAPRGDTPLGVDHYLSMPILGADLHAIVKKKAKRNAN